MPSFTRVIREVGEWIDAHSSAPVFDPQQLSRELPQFGLSDISQAIACLAEDGDFRPVFAVKTPTGVIADDLFRDVNEIPPEIRDRFNHLFLTSGSEIVPLFEFVKRK
jgi:hypothetical protein